MFPRRDSTLLNQLSEYANSILKIEVEKSGLEDMIKIGQLNLKQSATLLKYLVPGLQLELTSIIREGQKEGGYIPKL